MCKAAFTCHPGDRSSSAAVTVCRAVGLSRQQQCVLVAAEAVSVQQQWHCSTWCCQQSWLPMTVNTVSMQQQWYSFHDGTKCSRGSDSSRPEMCRHQKQFTLSGSNNKTVNKARVRRRPGPMQHSISSARQL
jgi:hypothetical protein